MEWLQIRGGMEKNDNSNKVPVHSLPFSRVCSLHYSHQENWIDFLFSKVDLKRGVVSFPLFFFIFSHLHSDMIQD